MFRKTTLAIPVSLFGVYIVWITGSAGTSIPNLTEECFNCLCHVATKCDLTHTCTGGYCGPFNISRIYWVDSGKVFLEDDDNDHGFSWKDCAKDYDCSKRTVAAYVEKFLRDCNGDGEINCYDFMMLNANGGYGCSAPLNRSVRGREWLQRYEECNL